MNEAKQIEEREKIISDICPFYKEYGTCEQCNTALDIDGEPCYFECMANAIIRNGYRKQIAGEWIRQKGRPEAICSKCGREVVYQVIDNKWAFENFCPHCGAKMKGGDEK